jgi:hypothetical protein
MSRSPKHTQASLSARRQRELHAEAERKQAEAQRWREEAERKQRIDRLEQLRVRMKAETDTLFSQLQELEKGGWRDYLDRKAVEAKHLQIDQFRDAIRAGQEEQLFFLAVQMRKVMSELTDARTRAQQSQLAALQSDASARIALTRRHLQEVDAALSAKFDPQAPAQVRDLLDEADAQVRAAKLDRADRSLQKAQEKLDQHRASIAAKHQKWLAQKQTTQARIQQTSDRVGAAGSDSTVLRWQDKSMAHFREAVTELEELLRVDKFDEAVRGSAEVERAVDEAIKAAHAEEAEEDKRLAVVDALQNALLELGWDVQRAGLEEPNDPRSRMILYADRAPGKQLGVGVPRDLHVCYEVNGFEFKTETDKQGRPRAVCDAAQAALERLHAVLGKDGINTDGLQWDDKPDDNDRHFEQLPIPTDRQESVGR